MVPYGKSLNLRLELFSELEGARIRFSGTARGDHVVASGWAVFDLDMG
jgi:hypothetical protein